MLYHPCAHPEAVWQLRKMVNECTRKYVITPYTRLSRERPLALVTWGCKLVMNHVDDKWVYNFIRTTALKSPEAHVSTDGQYNKHLIAKPEPVGPGFKDRVFCPVD